LQFRLDGFQVRITDSGYVVTVGPGEHPMIKHAPVSFVVPYHTARESPDGRYHACITEQHISPDGTAQFGASLLSFYRPAHVGLTGGAIMERTRKPSRGETIINENREWIAEQRKAGKSWDKIAQELGVGHFTILVYRDPDRATARRSAVWSFTPRSNAAATGWCTWRDVGQAESEKNP